MLTRMVSFEPQDKRDQLQTDMIAETHRKRRQLDRERRALERPQPSMSTDHALYILSLRSCQSQHAVYQVRPARSPRLRPCEISSKPLHSIPRNLDGVQLLLPSLHIHN